MPLNPRDSLAGGQRPRHRLAVRGDEPRLGCAPSRELLQNVTSARRFECGTGRCASAALPRGAAARRSWLLRPSLAGLLGWSCCWEPRCRASTLSRLICGAQALPQEFPSSCRLLVPVARWGRGQSPCPAGWCVRGPHGRERSAAQARREMPASGAGRESEGPGCPGSEAAAAGRVSG